MEFSATPNLTASLATQGKATGVPDYVTLELCRALLRHDWNHPAKALFTIEDPISADRSSSWGRVGNLANKTFLNLREQSLDTQCVDGPFIL